MWNLLQAHLQPEQLDEANSWYCPKCKTHRQVGICNIVYSVRRLPGFCSIDCLHIAQQHFPYCNMWKWCGC
jgi:hypothetical protein